MRFGMADAHEPGRLPARYEVLLYGACCLYALGDLAVKLLNLLLRIAEGTEVVDLRKVRTKYVYFLSHRFEVVLLGRSLVLGGHIHGDYSN